MKKFIFIIISFLLLAITAYSQWYPQFSGTSYDLNAVYFVSPDSGWAVGYEGTILMTTYGGYSWTFQNSDSSTNLRSVYFSDNNTGWIVGENGTMIATTNGGSNWLSQNSGTLSDLHKVYFINNSCGWAVGSGGTIKKTINGGTNWFSQFSGITNLFYSVFFKDSLNGWTSGGGGKILRTKNGGSNWSVQYSNPDLNNITDIYFVDVDTGWAVSDFNGTILKTTNSGTNWAVQYVTGKSLSSVHFISSDTGWAVGKSGNIYNTTNGGTNWIARASGSKDDLKGLSVFDANNGWTVGANGTILLYSPYVTTPDLINPAFNSSNVMSPTVFQWGAIAGATSYNLQISTVNNFSKILINQKNLTSPTVTSFLLKDNFTYFWRVSATTSSGTGSWSSVWSFSTINYCLAFIQTCSAFITEYISDVKINSIDSSSFCPTNGYSNFIAQSANLAKGLTYPITVTVVNSTPSDAVAAYIDWNENGILNDSGEVYILTTNNGGATFTGNITVPMNVPEGYTRLRVRLFDSLPMNPCGVTIFSKGDVEDYSINVIPSITLEPIQQTLYCSGDVLIIPFSVNNFIPKSDNIFSAWLSTNPPKLIGTVSGTSTGKYIIKYTIPDTTPAGYQYHVYITSSNPSLRSLNSNNFAINKIPDVFAVSGMGSFCLGSFGPDIRLSGSQIGIDYQLYCDSISVGSPLHGTGDSLNFDYFLPYINPVLGGTYTVYAINPTTFCSKKMDGSVNVFNLPRPDLFNLVSLENPQYCQGSQPGVDLILSSSDSGFIYQMYLDGNLINTLTGTGDTLFFGNQSNPGTYTVIAVNPVTLCSRIMDSSINVTILPLPSAFNLLSMGGGHYCQGSMVGVDITLSGTTSGMIYQLYYNGTLSMTFTGTGGPLSETMLYPSGIYTMKAVDTTTLCESWMLDTVIITVDSLFPVQNTAPVDSNISINPTNFSWSPALCASDYHLVVSTNSDLSSPLTDTLYSASSLTFPLQFNDFAMQTTYYWQVTTINNNDSTVSPILSFTTILPPPQQFLALHRGWNMISTNLIPQNDSMPVIWENKTGNLLIIKDGTGNYWMPLSTGALNYWNVLNGYQIYMTQPDTLIITGYHAPQTTPITFPSQGWYLISYLPQVPMQVSQALASLNNKLVIVKNGSGEIYFPMFGINTLEKSAGTMVPGKGYWIYVTKACTLIYPGN